MSGQKNPNVQLAGNDPSTLLYQFAAGGGGYTQLQRDAGSLAGEAGEALAMSEMVKQGIGTVGQAVNQGMGIYTDEKARQYKLKMLDGIHKTEQSLYGISDPAEHKKRYDEALTGLQDDLNNAGILKKDDLDYFKIFLDNQRSKYAEQNFVLQQRKTGDEAQLALDYTNNTLDSVTNNLDTVHGLINKSYQDTYTTLIEGGHSEDKAHQASKQAVMQHLKVAMSSRANPELVEKIATAMYDKDKEGNFKYFQQVEGQDRQQLAMKAKELAGKNRYGKYVLQLAQEKPLKESVILNDPFLDPQGKATLLGRNAHLLNENNSKMVRNWIKDTVQTNLGYSVRPEQAETFLSGEEIKNKAKEFGVDSVLMQNTLRQEYQKQRDHFEKDPIGTILQDPRFQGSDRNTLINMQKVFGLSGNQVRVLSDAEQKQFSDIFNNAVTPDDKMKIATFEHELSKGFLASMNLTTPEAQKQFAEQHRWDILRNMNTVSAEDKVAVDLMANNQGNANSSFMAQKLFNISIDRYKTGGYKMDDEALESKTASQFKTDFQDSDYGKYLMRNGYDKEYKTYMKAGQIYANSKYGRDKAHTDLEDALGIGVIQQSNMDLHFNKNALKKREVKNTLNGLQRNLSKHTDYLTSNLPNKEVVSELMQDPKIQRKIQDHGKWVSDGDNGFALIAEDASGRHAMYGYVPIKKNKDRQYLDAPNMQSADVSDEILLD